MVQNENGTNIIYSIEATTIQFTWIASFLAIGAIVGAVPSGIIADKIGRKKAAILITIPYIISYIITVFASNIPMLYAARFLIGEYVLQFTTYVKHVVPKKFAEYLKC